MAKFLEAGRQSAHVILDVVSAHPHLDDEATNPAAMNLALHRLNDVCAVTAEFDTDTHALDLEITPLLGAAFVSINWLATRLAEATSQSREEVTASLRLFIDED